MNRTFKVKLTTCWFGRWHEEIRIINERDWSTWVFPGVACEILEEIV